MPSQGKYTQQQLEAFVQEFEVSGLTHTEFVKSKKGLASSTFSYAKKAYGLPVLPRNGAFAKPEAANAVATPETCGKPPGGDVVALKAEVRQLRKMLALQWGLGR